MTLPHPIVREATLTSPSPIVNQLFELMFEPSSSLNDLSDILSTDAGLSARTLSAANAAYSSPKHRIDNVHEAVVRIGLVPVIHIITATEIKAVFLSVRGGHGDMKRLWTHNLVTACIADAYAHHLKLKKPARWFTAGMLHDIGRLLLLNHDPVKYSEVAAATATDSDSICDEEIRVFGISHQDIGMQLMTLWRFPESVAQAAYHHQQPFVSYDDTRSGISMVNDMAIALDGAGPLPQYEAFSAERVIAEASVKYELMKKASGFS